MPLLEAYVELQNRILDHPDVAEFLADLCDLCAAIVPGTHCGVILRHGTQMMSSGGSDGLARRLDEVQGLQGNGPCLEALRTASCVDVPDLSTETRWGGYASFALAHGVASSFSIPVVVEGASVGALNLFGSDAGAFSSSDKARAQAFAAQAGTALTLLLRQARVQALDSQMREALATRAVIDQALGILMHARRIGAGEALDALRRTSQVSNRKVSVIAAEIIERTTGHPVEPPCPLGDRE